MRDTVQSIASALAGRASPGSGDFEAFGVVSSVGDVTYVALDGGDTDTPATPLVEVDADERVRVQVVNHKAYVTGNISMSSEFASGSSSSSTLDTQSGDDSDDDTGDTDDTDDTDGTDADS